MILIASGAYLQGEFTSEVGLLPPSFLPIGNKRLYEYQVIFLKESAECPQDIYISIPTSYAMDDYDELCLKALGVQVLRVPDGLSLGDSILYCWNATAKHHESLTLLHGDTLFLNTHFKKQNVISVHPNRGFYKRASLGKETKALEKVHDDWTNDSERVISGFFNFSEPLFFMKSLIESKNNFVQAIVFYHRAYPLNLISTGDWLDFGHINSFYHSRTKMTTQRAFNALQIGLRTVSKSSKDRSKKIYAEGNWFAQLPLPLRLYTPALLGLECGDSSYAGANYELEYLHLLPLSDLFVFSHLIEGSWKTIFNGVATMLEDFASYSPDVNKASVFDEINGLYLPKTLERLAEYAQQTGFELSDKCFTVVGFESLNLVQIAQQASEFITPVKPQDIAIIHGDLCFSNLLYDSRVESVKCIDPRGLTPTGELSIYGDRRYDLAKLYHSVIGLYDFIIAGHFTLQMDDVNCFEITFSDDSVIQQCILENFKELVLKPSGYSEKEILAITVHLFLSMLPLHSDRPERQKAFIANALRLFNLLRELDS